MKKGKHHIGLILFSIVLIALLGVLGVSYKQFASKQLNPVETTKVSKGSSSVTSSKSADKIIGAFIDDEDGAAIVLKKNGTGRYVYADKDNPDTDDDLTWKKDGGGYLITLNDKDVTNPLNARFAGEKLIITGTGGWNTESFQRADGNLNLETFLQEMHKK